MNDILEKAIQKRDEFLEKHPHMKEFQVEVDELLNKCGNQKDRLITSQILLSAKLNDLSKELEKIQYISNKLHTQIKLRPGDKKKEEDLNHET